MSYRRIHMNGFCMEYSFSKILYATPSGKMNNILELHLMTQSDYSAIISEYSNNIDSEIFSNLHQR